MENGKNLSDAFHEFAGMVKAKLESIEETLDGQNADLKDMRLTQTNAQKRDARADEEVIRFREDIKQLKVTAAEFSTMKTHMRSAWWALVAFGSAVTYLFSPLRDWVVNHFTVTGK